MNVMQPDDIKKLTGSGTKQNAIECLIANKIRFVIGVDGWPRIPIVWLTDVKESRTSTSEGPNLDQI